jgi:L-seryl-tRNA(Ser) seleniumtransferase
VLGALQEVALTYLRRDGLALPFWRMASVPVAELRARAEALGVGEVVSTESLPGAGSLPGTTIPSAGVAVAGDHLARLRACEPAVIARVRDERTVCDLRTVDPADDELLASALRAALQEG